MFPLVSSLALCVLFSCRKIDLSYLSQVICPNLHGKLKYWTSAFYLSFLLFGFTQNTEYISLWIGLFQLFVFVSYVLCFFLRNFTSYGICIDANNEQKFYVINFYVFFRDSQSRLWQDILVLCCTFKIIIRLYILV